MVYGRKKRRLGERMKGIEELAKMRETKGFILKIGAML